MNKKAILVHRALGAARGATDSGLRRAGAGTSAAVCLLVSLALLGAARRSAGLPEAPASTRGPVEMTAGQENQLGQKIDGIFAPFVGQNSPGLAVLIREGGTTMFKRGYGLADLRTERKIDARTNFRLASVSKQFTAAAVMLLAHDGKLRADETLGEILPEFPEYGRKIAIRQLLNHTSGLPDYETLMEKPREGKTQWSATRQIRDAEVLDLLEGETAGKFTPGTRWAYSNSGYVLLGLIVAKISGRPYDEFLKERVFAPLGMDRTAAFVLGKNEVPDRAFGHSRDGGGFRQTDQGATSATLGDGGVYSNLEDLEKWDEALARRAFLGEKEMQAVLTPARLADGSLPVMPEEEDFPEAMRGRPVSYGFGWFLDPYRGRPRMWHTGTTVGFRTVIQRFPEDRQTIIVLANRTDLEPSELALRVADLLESQRHSPRRRAPTG
jgi:CubicO group peptidase (beta-lactamase class C family)